MRLRLGFPLWVLGLGMSIGCMGGGALIDGSADGAPGGPGEGPPGEPPPTGGKWEGVLVEDGCGKVHLEWVVVDEVCAGTDDADYMEFFRAPMIRDGAIIGDHLFAVDATNLWVLDNTDPTAMTRVLLASGLGQPIGAAQHAGRLLLAAGDAGLLVLDVSDPIEPTLIHQVALPGPALDLAVDGDAVYVATGAAGLSKVSLAGTPTLLETLPVPGFTAAATVRDGLAYVAACSSLSIVDLATGAPVGSTWLAGAYDGDFLVAPAKDVELVGDVAFVAAGRFGAVAVNVASPAAPTILGNCTVQHDLAFYASGVRAAGGKLFVAGGEYGILPVEVSDPLSACDAVVQPLMLELPEDGGECSTKPPWEEVPWQSSWVPPTPQMPDAPPPGQDPIQTLPHGGLVYAFGDATRVGMRAVDVRLADDPALTKIGRYEEPRLLNGIAARNGRILVVGTAGGLFWASDADLVVADPDPIALAQDGVAGVFLEDGRWAIATGDQVLHVEGAAPLGMPSKVYPNSLSVIGSRVAAPTLDGAALFDPDAGTLETFTAPTLAALPITVFARQDSVVVAAPEWTHALELGGRGAVELPAHQVFDLDQIMNASEWRHGLPRRLLSETSAGLVEVATLGAHAGLVAHDAGSEIALPAGDYLDVDAAGSRLYLVASDRKTYRSLLVTVQIAPDGATVTSVESFLGAASGVAADGGRVYVADADGAIRVYDDGAVPELLGVVELEVSP